MHTSPMPLLDYFHVSLPLSLCIHAVWVIMLLGYSLISGRVVLDLTDDSSMERKYQFFCVYQGW